MDPFDPENEPKRVEDPRTCTMTTAAEPIPAALLLSFFQEATKELNTCDLSAADKEAVVQPKPVFRQRLLAVQRAALERVVANFEGFTADDVQAELKNAGNVKDESLLQPMMEMNDAARLAFARLLLHQEVISERVQSPRTLIDSGKIERKALLEFFALCNTVVRLESVWEHLKDGKKPLFNEEDEAPPDSGDAFMLFPQKRLEHIQRMVMRAVGYDPDFGTAEMQRIFASPENEFSDDGQVHAMFRNLGVNMNTVVTNASISSTSQFNDQDEGGSTRVVSVSYSERVVDGEDTTATNNIGAPRQEAIHNPQLQMAREAAALQQRILGELLSMSESERAATLEEAGAVQEEFQKDLQELAPEERVAFVQQLQPDRQRLLLMHKLWTVMLQQNGGKPPTMRNTKSSSE